MDSKKLVKNVIMCNHCNDIIESKYTHDFKTCKCGTVSVDGGLAYAKRCFKNSTNDFTDLSVWKDIKDLTVDYIIISKPSHIIFDCPYCKTENIEVAFKEVKYNTDYWGDGANVDCPICGKEVTLGDWGYE